MVENNQNHDWSSEDENENLAQEHGVTLEIEPSMDVPAEGEEVDVNVRITVPVHSSARRKPVDIVICIDVSGSMQLIAEYNDPVTDELKDDGLSYLDIVKHASKAVMFQMDQHDRMGCVTYSTESEQVFPLTAMSEALREDKIKELNACDVKSSTNLWAGLHASLETLRSPPGGNQEERMKVVMILTDGQPNEIPERGHIPELRDYKDQFPEFHFQINTFGFSYALDSQLLLDLAIEGNGTYGFVPDALVLGTNFVNSCANIMSTYTQQATLRLVPLAGADFVGPILGDHTSTQESWGRQVDLGPLQFGQARDIVVSMKVPGGSQPYLEAHISYSLDGTQQKISTEATSRQATQAAILASLRSNTVSVGYQCVKDTEAGRGHKARQDLFDMAEQLELFATMEGASLAMKELHSDVSGRMTKALDGSARFHRWGKHYLRAISRSHQVMQQTNYIDRGLQVYGGPFFQKLRAAGDKGFLLLQIARPQAFDFSADLGEYADQYRREQAAPVYQAPIDNTVYYGRDNDGCFGESSTVTLEKDSLRLKTKVCNVKKGDKIVVADGTLATVTCLVRIARTKSICTLPGGLTITGGHPMRINGQWTSARQVSSAVETTNPSGYVYTFVLDRSHIPLVNDIECVTWGHGLTEAGVSHPYYGTDKVLQDLRNHSGWSTGFVDFISTSKVAPNSRVAQISTIQL